MKGSTVISYTLNSNIDKGLFFDITELSLHLVDRVNRARIVLYRMVRAFVVSGYSSLLTDIWKNLVGEGNAWRQGQTLRNQEHTAHRAGNALHAVKWGGLQVKPKGKG